MLQGVLKLISCMKWLIDWSVYYKKDFSTMEYYFCSLDYSYLNWCFFKYFDKSFHKVYLQPTSHWLLSPSFLISLFTSIFCNFKVFLYFQNNCITSTFSYSLYKWLEIIFVFFDFKQTDGRRLCEERTK